MSGRFTATVASDGPITVTASRRAWYELAVTLYQHPPGYGISGDEPTIQSDLRRVLEELLIGEKP